MRLNAIQIAETELNLLRQGNAPLSTPIDVKSPYHSLTPDSPVNGEGSRASNKVSAFLLLTPSTPSRRAAFLFPAS